MSKYFAPLAALIAGFVWGFAVAGLHSLLFALLPPAAFAFGWFSSRRRGLLSGLLLFAGYTFALSMIWWGPDSPNLLYPVPYLAAFVAGGFSLPLIGFLAPAARKGLGRPSTVAALAILAIATGWSGFTALPHYSYYYQVVVQSSEALNDLELHLPPGAVAGTTYADLFSQPLRMPQLTGDYTVDIVDTDRGTMLKLSLPALKQDDVPDPRYTSNVIFREERAPRQLMQLSPRTDPVPVNSMRSRQSVGPITSHESLTIERFQVPVKVSAGKLTRVKLTLWNRTDRAEAVNFGYSFNRSYSYTERIGYDLQSDGTWKSVPVEATSLLEIRGISD